MKNKIEIELPSMCEQMLMIMQEDTDKSIATLKSNLLAKHFPKAENVDYASIDPRIYLTLEEGWVAPPAQLVDAWFNQFKSLYSDYRSDAKLGFLLGLRGKEPDRRMRAYRKGDEQIPYGLWREFLELTGRAVPEVKPVFGIFDMEEK